MLELSGQSKILCVFYGDKQSSKAKILAILASAIIQLCLHAYQIYFPVKGETYIKVSGSALVYLSLQVARSSQ